MPDKKSESQVLIMTGMHRSGTSLTASLLQVLGCTLVVGYAGN
ncbi:hypothetical protein [Limnospira maxima]|nr:hypothetical protein [Limnospira maxima]